MEMGSAWAAMVVDGRRGDLVAASANPDVWRNGGFVVDDATVLVLVLGVTVGSARLR